MEQSQLEELLAEFRRSQDQQLQVLKKIILISTPAAREVPDTTQLSLEVLHKPLDELLNSLNQSSAHYTSGWIPETLRSITQDLVSNQNIHDAWQENTGSDAVKRLALSVKNEFLEILDDFQLFYGRTHFAAGSYALSICGMDEVHTINGVNFRPSDEKSLFRLMSTEKAKIEVPDSPKLDPSVTPRLSRGIVITTKEWMPNTSRVALLLVLSFSLRLQDEDYSFIQGFLIRHLSVEPNFGDPARLTNSSPSSTKTIRYRRTSFSFHLPHYLLDTLAKKTTEDRQYIGVFSANKDLGLGGKHLFRGSSSVIVTISISDSNNVFPSYENSAKSLWSNPEASWTVLMINTAPEMVHGLGQSESLKNITPLAQFLRGLWAITCAVQENQRPILLQLKEYCKSMDSEDIFEDKGFSRSILFHWAIKTCRDLLSQIEANLRCMRKFQVGELDDMMNRANSYEDCGVRYWNTRWREEITEMEVFQIELRDFIDDMKELREALHSATALFESRVALKQSEDIRLLTYITLGYLPVVIACSLFSIQVLPQTATLASFIVTAIAIIFTTFLAILNAQNMRGILKKINEYLTGSIRNMMRKTNKEKWLSIERRLGNNSVSQWWYINYLVWAIFVAVPIQEVVYALKLFRFVPREKYQHRMFSPTKLVFDLLRLFLTPLWIVLVGFGLSIMAFQRAVAAVKKWWTERNKLKEESLND